MRREFLLYLTKPRSAKISLLLCIGFVITAVVEAVSRFTLPAVLLIDFLDAAMILRLSYESTLLFFGYGFLIYGILRGVFTMFRDPVFRARANPGVGIEIDVNPHTGTGSSTSTGKLLIHFIILLSFILSFLIARLFVAILNADVNPLCQLWVKGYRIHHFFFGIGLLIVGGWLGHINYSCGSFITRLSAGIYGIGLGLVADEFGLLLTFGDYWTEQSYIFFVLISLLLTVALLVEAYRLFKTRAKYQKI